MKRKNTDRQPDQNTIETYYWKIFLLPHITHKPEQQKKYNRHFKQNENIYTFLYDTVPSLSIHLVFKTGSRVFHAGLNYKSLEIEKWSLCQRKPEKTHIFQTHTSFLSYFGSSWAPLFPCSFSINNKNV